ncbi:MAG: NTP transferase domain-containing protein [Flavobacteriales bacterium]|nr:NTP transferase domain-containing protein [Flavobacteriales bacterium]
MKIIVPMAGMGKRMRPHTLTVAKPLIPVAGKPVVQWLVEDITRVCGQKVDEIAYVVGRFGEENEKNLIRIAESLGAKGSIHYQDEPLGTAHAILCAKEALSGPVTVAFADTLFTADFTLDGSKDGIIWVKSVENPAAFGVVKTNGEGIITDFIEKPKTFVSDLAIIGIYYFRDGENLKNELQYLIDNDIRGNNEYQLTDALENMKAKGVRFATGKVEEWLDCGNKNVTVFTNQRVLENHKKENMVSASAKVMNSVIVPPCFIGENVSLHNSVIGPHVSIGMNSVVENSIISNSIIQTHAKIADAHISNSMIGNFAEYKGKAADLSIGDYTQIG